MNNTMFNKNDRVRVINTDNLKSWYLSEVGIVISDTSKFITPSGTSYWMQGMTIRVFFPKYKTSYWVRSTSLEIDPVWFRETRLNKLLDE